MRRTQGFTLVEVVVSIVIIGIAFIPLYSIFEGSLGVSQSTQKQMQANQLAQQVVESIKGESFNNLLQKNTQEVEEGGIFFTVEGSRGLVAEVYITPQIDTNVYPMEVESIHIQQVSEPNKKGIKLNGHVYAFTTEDDLPLLSISYSKNEEGFWTKIEGVTSKGERRLLYSHTTKVKPIPIELIISKPNQPIKVVSTINEKQPIEVIKAYEDNQPPIVLKEGASSVVVTYYEAYQWVMNNTFQNTLYYEAINEEDRKISFYTMGGKEEHIIKKGYMPFISLMSHEPATLTIYNRVPEALDLAIQSPQLSYVVEEGMINAHFNALREQEGQYMVYSVNVVVKDEDEKALATIYTTKRE